MTYVQKNLPTLNHAFTNTDFESFIKNLRTQQKEIVQSILENVTKEEIEHSSSLISGAFKATDLTSIRQGTLLKLYQASLITREEMGDLLVFKDVIEKDVNFERREFVDISFKKIDDFLKHDKEKFKHFEKNDFYRDLNNFIQENPAAGRILVVEFPFKERGELSKIAGAIFNNMSTFAESPLKLSEKLHSSLRLNFYPIKLFNFINSRIADDNLNPINAQYDLQLTENLFDLGRMVFDTGTWPIGLTLNELGTISFHGGKGSSADNSIHELFHVLDIMNAGQDKFNMGKKLFNLVLELEKTTALHFSVDLISEIVELNFTLHGKSRVSFHCGDPLGSQLLMRI